MPRKRTGTIIAKPSGLFARLWVKLEDGTEERRWFNLETKDRAKAKRVLAKLVAEIEAGRLVADAREVIAAPEPLAEIRADSPFELVRLAYHLGNRHLPVQLRRGSIRIRRDAVIEDMVRRLGGTIVQVDGPFDPEGGAYGGPDLSVDYGASLEPPAGDHAHGRP